MKTGYDLIEEVFKELIEEGMDINLSELRHEEIDDVTVIEDDIERNEGWYNYYKVTIEYKGKRYSFNVKEHTSDNVCDTEYNEDSFREVEIQYNLSLNKNEYELLKELLEIGYYRAKDNSDEEQQENIKKLDEKLI